MEPHHHSGGNCVQGPEGGFRRGSWDMALGILWGTISPLQHYFRHTLHRTMLLPSEKSQQKENQESLISAQLQSQAQGWRNKGPKNKEQTEMPPNTRDQGWRQPKLSSPTHGWRSLAPVQSGTGAPTPPQAPQHMCLGTTPSPLDHREAKQAGIWDCNDHIKVNGSEYGGGLFTLAWFQESC